MSNDIADILRAIENFEKTPASVGVELRVSFSEIVTRKLRERKWTQRRLADEAGIKEPFISRIIHSGANCTFDTAAKLLFALGIRAQFIEAPLDREVRFVATGVSDSLPIFKGVTHGQEVQEGAEYVKA